MAGNIENRARSEGRSPGLVVGEDVRNEIGGFRGDYLFCLAIVGGGGLNGESTSGRSIGITQVKSEGFAGGVDDRENRVERNVSAEIGKSAIDFSHVSHFDFIATKSES